MYFLLHLFLQKLFRLYISRLFKNNFQFALYKKTAIRFTLQLTGLCMIRLSAERNFRIGCMLSFA